MEIVSTFSYASLGNDGMLYSWDVNGGQRVIGVAIDRYQQTKSQLDQALAKAEELHKMCVDNGLIVIPPTQEELLQKALKELQSSREQNQVNEVIPLIALDVEYVGCKEEPKAELGKLECGKYLMPLTIPKPD